MRLDGEVLVSFNGRPWKPVVECTAEERAVVIALDALNTDRILLDGLCVAIADWSDDDVAARLEVPLPQVPWLREGRGRFWTVVTAFTLKEELDMTLDQFFADVMPLER